MRMLDICLGRSGKFCLLGTSVVHVLLRLLCVTDNETSGEESFCLVKNKNRNRPAVIQSPPSPSVNS